MRICHVVKHMEIPYRGGKCSGATTHAYEVARGLIKRGHSVYLLCCRGKGQTSSQEIDGIAVKRIFKPQGRLYSFLRHSAALWIFFQWPYYAFKNLGEITALILFLARNPCDLVYERPSLATKIHSLIYLFFGLPLVIEVNDYYDFISANLTRYIITTNKGVIPFRYRHKVKELSWGANTEVFRPGLEASELKLKYSPDNKKIVLIVCSGVPWHGLYDLITAAKTITKQRQDVVFMVVGGGDHFSDYIERAASLGLEDKFIFTGVVDYARIPEVISMSDITVACYNSELKKIKGREFLAAPLKVFEYMACAKPIVITEVANKNKIIEDKRTGLVIKEDSPQELAEAILSLLENQSLRLSLGENARAVAENKFSWQAHVLELEKLFESILR